MVKFVWGLLLLLIPCQLLAQQFTPDPDWRFESFNSQNHFISREIPALTMDKQGYIWTCGGGLQRFDGYKTIEFNSFDRAKGTIRSNYTDVVADNNGRIWVNSAGLCYYDNAANKFTYINPGPGHAPYVNALFVQKNYLWFICGTVLAKINVQTLKITYTALTNVINPLGIFAINDSTLLVSSREKAYTYNIKQNTYLSNALVYNHTLLKIYTSAKNAGNVFVGTNHGLFLFKSLNNVQLLIPETKDVIVEDLVFMPQDKQKKYLFLATGSKGIMVYNTQLKKVEFTYSHTDDNPFSLPDNVISKFYADKTGRLWMGTHSGMSMLDIDNQQWKTRMLNKTNADDVGIIKIEADKYDNSKVYMACFNKGIMCVNWQTKQVEKVYNNAPELQGLNNMVQLSADKWLLSTPKMVIEWSPRSGILFERKLPLPDSLQLLYNIRNLITADANNCYITTGRGLFKYNLASHQISSVSLSASGSNLKYDLLNGFYDNGMLYIASRAGVFTYNINTNATAIYRGRGEWSDYYFFDVSPAPNNQVVCAAGNGITIFNRQTKTFKVVNVIANLYKPDCVNVVCINNTVWVSSEAGILNYNLLTGVSARAEHENPQLQIFPGSPFSVIGNAIVVGFSNGYAYFTPGQKDALVASDPLIESVYVNNKPVLQQCPAKQSAKLVLSHTQNSINIAFTSFLYNDPDHINFRYKLKGADTDWQYTQNQRSANYAQLQPGDYTFYVQSGSGVWNSNLASFAFKINPPYWATWRFRLLVILVIAFILYRLYRYKINHILAIEKIRERIASDFHDDIGSALSSISIFSEVADNQLKQQLPHEQTREVVGRISFHAYAMLDAMDDIVWAVNPLNDHFNNLAVRMREFALPLFEARNIRFDMDVQGNILNTRIKMEARKNIFLIFKECVNNVLKHSACTVTTLTVNKVNKQLELIITDNGKGFNPDAPTSRNGLKNMQKRAAEIGGAIQVTTAPGKGTVTRLLVNII